MSVMHDFAGRKLMADGLRRAGRFFKERRDGDFGRRQEAKNRFRDLRLVVQSCSPGSASGSSGAPNPHARINTLPGLQGGAHSRSREG